MTPGGDLIKQSDFCTLTLEVSGFAKQLKSMKRRAYPTAYRLIDASRRVKFASVTAHHPRYLGIFGSGLLGPIYYGALK
jgi:hypothetical protein